MKRFLVILFTIINALHMPLLAEEEWITNPPGIDEALIEKNTDIEIISPKYGDVFGINEAIELKYSNKNPEREYIFVPYYYYVLGKWTFGVTYKGEEDMTYTIKPEYEGIIVLQLLYYDKDKYWSEEKEKYKYGSDILVLGIGMDIPDYWMKRFVKGRKEDPIPPKPVIIEDPNDPKPTPIIPPTPPVSAPPIQPPTPIPTKPFIFPFSKAVGVSQWHGYTAFQSPHTGIDFSVAREDTRAIGDGTVIGKGYDTYYGECLSGGNYLTIQHDNGMHTSYMHLEQSFVNVGQRVAKGQIIAKTGNSGSWNCKPLGFHLHFEVRKTRSQSTHVNPVEYIEQDWDLIPTVGYEAVPGRLTGDNPHPGR